jgi:chromate transport protein ChrA
MLKLNLRPAPDMLRQFAWVSLIALPLFAAFFTRGDARWFAPWAWQWTHPVVLGIAALGALQLVLMLAGVRQLSLAIYVVIMVVAWPIGFVVSNVLIAAIFYLLITPIGLIFRVTGRDMIGRRIDRSRASYWHDRGRARPASSYFKLY